MLQQTCGRSLGVDEIDGEIIDSIGQTLKYIVHVEKERREVGVVVHFLEQNVGGPMSLIVG
jgi:hypothetical protein